MDHLPCPKDGIPPHIVVPILGKTASGTAIYDGGDYMSFPERRGFRTRAEIDGHNRMLDAEALSQHSYLSVLAFIQAWLYFGLLHSAFAILGVGFDETSFIRQTEDGDTLSTLNLQTLLKRPATTFSMADWIVGRHAIRVPDNAPLRRLCHHALAQVQDLEHLWLRPERVAAPFPEIMLSIRILASTLLVWNRHASDQSWTSGGSLGTLVPSMLPIYNHLLKTKGWCPHQALHLCTHFSPVTLYYLASMKRRRKADHSQCAQSERCVASNIKKGFIAKHVAPCTGVDCTPVVALNQHRLLDIVKNGDIPVVIASEGAEGIELRYAPANPHYGYIAPSHVWSDGLGDPDDNHLPRCQLTQLLERLYEAEKSVAYSNGRLAGRGTQVTTRRFNGRYPKLLEGPLVFWLDAYCIPAFSTDDEVKKLKMSAIMRMVPTYGLAQQVLVLDSELPKLSKQATGLDLMAVICTWRSRYWTHQELTLAGTKSVVVQYRRPVLLQRLLRISSIGGDPYGDEPIYNLTSKAKKDGSLKRALVERISNELASVLEEGKVGATQVQNRQINMGKETREALERIQRLISWQSPGAIVAEDVFFLKMWCSFLGKTSSLPEDMHGILANLLNLDADEVIKLERKERLRSILASYGRLPMNLLLSIPPLSPSGNQVRQGSDGPAEDRWIPMLPDGRDIPSTPLPQGLYFVVSADGLVCSPSVPNCVIRIQQPPADLWRADGWYVHVEIECPQRKLRKQMCFQVILICEDDGSTNPWRSDEMLLFLPTLHASSAEGEEHPGDPNIWQRGACFRRLSQDNKHVWSHWVCAVKYRRVSPTNLSDVHLGANERHCAGRRMVDVGGMSGRQLGIACSTDPSTWPRVRVKRRPGILSDKTNPWLAGLNVILLFGWPIMLLVGIGVSTSHPPLVAPILITAACIFLAFIIYTPCQYMYHLAQWYIGLASFYEEDESYRFWWRKLHRTLPFNPQRGREGWRHGMFVSQAAIWGLHFVVFVMRVVEPPCVEVVRIWRWRKLASRRQPDGVARVVEDGIQLER